MKTKRKKTLSSRVGGKIQISISLSSELVRKIDKLAASENRNRSNFIVTAMERSVAASK